jgi:hypothetical protein
LQELTILYFPVSFFHSRLLLQVVDEGSLLFGFVAALRKDSSSDSSLSSMC